MATFLPIDLSNFSIPFFTFLLGIVSLRFGTLSEMLSFILFGIILIIYSLINVLF